MFKLYCVFDSLAERFHVPFALQNDAMAIRSFVAAVHEGNTPLSDSPMDFALFRIGDFDPETGWIQSEVSPVRVFSGLEAKQKRAVELKAASEVSE